MKLSKLTLAVTVTLGASISSAAFAIDLYMDTKTKQIFAEPGKNRVKLGTFEQKSEKKKAEKHEGQDDFSDFKHRVEEDLDTKRSEIKALEEHVAESEKVKVTMDKKGLQVRSADDNFKFRFGGRIHADASYSGHDNFTDTKGNHVQANDGTEIRRARMRMEGVFFKDWLFRTEADFAGDKVAMKDVYIQYLGAPHLVITAGQQKQNFSRELQESSNDMMFTERSLMNVLNGPVVDRAIGLNLESFGKHYTAKLGVFGDSLTPPGSTSTVDSKGVVKSTTNAGDEGWGISSRLAYAPINEKGELVHVGIAGNYRVPDTNGEVAKSKELKYAYQTTNMSGLDPVNAKVTDVKDIKMLGLEAAGVYGPFSVGGEYTRTWINRNNDSDNLTFDGWYADAAWTITGESRTYKNGNMTYLEPANPFNPSLGHWGAVELAARYSSVDLNSGNFFGGKMSEATIGLNWYFNTNVRLQANYTRILNVDNGLLKEADGREMDGMNTFTLRGQVAF